MSDSNFPGPERQLGSLPRLPIRSLRFPGESDNAFRRRAQRAARIARILVEACLENTCMRAYIADPALPYSEETVRICPTVRVEYEHAVAIGEPGSCLRATGNKRWGAGPWILPLERDDWFYPDRITYIYKPSSLYNRRFEQRRRLKELLGKAHRKLVQQAQWHSKQIFLRDLTADAARAIRRRLNTSPGQFWRAARGKAFLVLPPRLVQGELSFPDEP